MTSPPIGPPNSVPSSSPQTPAPTPAWPGVTSVVSRTCERPSGVAAR